MAKLFGTDGIRAVAGTYPLDPMTVFRLGKALTQLGRHSVIIGRDTRESGLWIEKVLHQAMVEQGVVVTLAGVMTTPGIALLSRLGPFEAGIVVSASHNPYGDNGIKFFSSKGLKLSGEEENRLEVILRKGSASHACPDHKMENDQLDAPLARLTWSNAECVDSYLAFLRRVTPYAFESLKVVLDCGNGAAYHIAPRIFRQLGADIIPLNIEPNGHNINLHCGSLYPQQMAEAVVHFGASFGVAFDGDADRAIFADGHGNLLDGDYILYILSRSLLQGGSTESKTVVATVMANMGLEVALCRQGIKLLRVPVGDRYVLEEMLRGNHILGGEQSGHIIIRQHSLAGDGILTALTIAQIVCEKGCSLADLSRGMKKFPQVLLNLKVEEKRDFSQIPEIKRVIELAENELGDGGRVLVRYSGTEPLVRIMLEGEKQDQIQLHAQSIAALFRQHLAGAIS